jgi:Flp pilus assembly protein TadG
MKPALRRRRFIRDKAGVTAVEFAFVAPVFIAIVLAILQVAVAYFAKTALQSATQTAARLVFTGQTGTTYNSKAKFQQALCANIPVIIQCNGLLISLAPQGSLSSVSTATPKLTYDANGNVTNTFTYNAGAGNQIMVLQVLYQLPVVAGPLFGLFTQANGTLLTVATVVFQNEPA